MVDGSSAEILRAARRRRAVHASVVVPGVAETAVELRAVSGGEGDLGADPVHARCGEPRSGLWAVPEQPADQGTEERPSGRMAGTRPVEPAEGVAVAVNVVAGEELVPPEPPEHDLDVGPDEPGQGISLEHVDLRFLDGADHLAQRSRGGSAVSRRCRGARYRKCSATSGGIRVLVRRLIETEGEGPEGPVGGAEAAVVPSRISAAAATIMLESSPPERAIPTGTSLRSWRSTARWKIVVEPGAVSRVSIAGPPTVFARFPGGRRRARSAVSPPSLDPCVGDPAEAGGRPRRGLSSPGTYLRFMKRCSAPAVRAAAARRRQAGP